MGVDIYTHNTDREFPTFVFVCNTTDVAFSAVFHGTEKDAHAFMEWLPKGVRSYETEELRDLYYDWKRQKKGEFTTAQVEAITDKLSSYAKYFDDYDDEDYPDEEFYDDGLTHIRRGGHRWTFDVDCRQKYTDAQMRKSEELWAERVDKVIKKVVQ
jgi:hypothetical protein